MGYFSLSHRKFLTPLLHPRFVKKRVERKWMYQRLDDRKNIRRKFVKGVGEFIEYAKRQEEFKRSGKMRCPCRTCKNSRCLNVDSVKDHLYSKGFCPHYYNWTCHGEETFLSKKGQLKRQRQGVKKDDYGGRNKRKADALDVAVDMSCTEASWSGSSSTDASYAPSYSPEMQTHLDNQAYLDKRVVDESHNIIMGMRIEFEQCRGVILEEALKFREDTCKFWDVSQKAWEHSKKFQEETLLRCEQMLQQRYQNYCNSVSTPQFCNPQQPSNAGGCDSGAAV